MLIKRLISLTISGLIFSVAALFALWPAQTPNCPYSLSPRGEYANIRETSSTTAKIAGQLVKGRTVCAVELAAGWYKLAEGGGYIRSDVVIASTPVAQATPTRIPSATPTLSREPRVIIIEGENGVAEFVIICPVPCEFSGDVRNLP